MINFLLRLISSAASCFASAAYAHPGHTEHAPLTSGWHAVHHALETTLVFIGSGTGIALIAVSMALCAMARARGKVQRQRVAGGKIWPRRG